MAIGNAVQSGGFVRVYNERNIQLCTIGIGSSNKNDGLKGYTSSTVNIQIGGFIYTYDEKGRQLSCRGL